MASTMVVPQVPPAQSVQAHTQAAAANAAASERRYRIVQLVLFTAGGVLMPAGIVAILLGWYGVAHTKYQYNQLPYVVSGGLLGLALVFLGGFLYFGAWLARVANEQRESTRRLADTMLLIADLVSRQQGTAAAHGLPVAESGDVLVLAGSGSTVHRRDCALIAHRDDLHPLTGAETGLGACRVCRPTLD